MDLAKKQTKNAAVGVKEKVKITELTQSIMSPRVRQPEFSCICLEGCFEESL